MAENKTNLLYFLDNKPYINMTNACTNACVFCVREQKDDVQGAKLWLEEDNVRACDVILQIDENKQKLITCDEIVFCGYGEPLLRLDEVIEIAKYIKDNFKNLKIRINTNGHANAVYNKNVAPALSDYIDVISVSLNADNEENYNKISKPKIKNAYEEVKRFIRACVEEKITTIATVVTGAPGCDIDVQRCEVIAKSLGAKFRNREWIKNGY